MTGQMDEIKKAIQNHEKRISKLEKAIFTEKAKPKGKREFKGLSGGIEYLISKEFLNTPKSVKEIHNELRKEGYHYQEKSVDKLLRIDFMAKRKILTRIKENNVWKYAVRK
jgi:hypothetical protein